MAAATVVLLRKLGKDAVGVYTLAKLAPSFAALLGIAGLSANYPRLVLRAEWGPGRLWGLSLAWTAVVGGAGAVCWAVMSPLIAVRLFDGSVTVPTTRLLALGVPLEVLFIFCQALLASLQQHRHVVLGQLWDNLLTGAAGAAAGFAAASADGVALSVLAAMAAVAGLQARAVWCATGGPRLDFRRDHVREAVALGLKAYVGSVASLANYRLDVLLLGVLWNVGAAGVYGIVTKVAEVGRYFTVSVTQFWTPHVARQGPADAWLATRGMFFRTWATSAILSVLLGVSAPTILRLIGPGMDAGLVPLYLILFGLALAGGNGPLVAYNVSVGDPMANSWPALAALMVTVALDVLLIPSFGMTGASVASMISYTTFAGALAFGFLRSRHRHAAPRTERAS